MASKVLRDKFVQKIEWSPDDSKRIAATYFETWKINKKGLPPQNVDLDGRLHNSQIQQWLLHEGEYRIPQLEGNDILGGVRVLVCERLGWLGCSLAKDSFVATEKAFQLPADTLPSFFIHTGTCSRRFIYEGDQVVQVALTVRLNQKFQIGNFGVSLVYDVRTRFTNALIFGTGVWSTVDNLRPRAGSHWDQLLQFFRGSLELSNHPLMLPLLILQDNFDRLHQYCTETLDPRMIEIEHQLGVTKAGALVHAPADVFMGRKSLRDTRNEIQDLTVRMNTGMTEFIFIGGCTVLQREYFEFLIKLSQEVNQLLSHERGFLEQNRWVHQEIEHLEVGIRTLSHFVDRLKARMEVQLSTLYNFVNQADSLATQVDTRISAKLAATSQRDSTAMKILAFITALFLPGSFVAALFSMSMFDFSPSFDPGTTEGQGNARISKSFWIYCVITIPLTAIVLLAWRIWWKREQKESDRDLERAMIELELLRTGQNVDSPSFISYI
ncbi:hypothetical protein CPB86DRAFT_874182 [Serendipita vermifera]|nr:hypothetical protein CPB86DRAFT_874182 [Serendipita vermifera]